MGRFSNWFNSLTPDSKFAIFVSIFASLFVFAMLFFGVLAKIPDQPVKVNPKTGVQKGEKKSPNREESTSEKSEGTLSDEANERDNLDESPSVGSDETTNTDSAEQNDNLFNTREENQSVTTPGGQNQTGDVPPGGNQPAATQGAPHQMGNENPADIPPVNNPGSLGKDTIPPLLTILLSPDLLWPPDRKMVKIQALISVTDNFDLNPAVILTSVVSNEPDDAEGSRDGHTVNDIQGTDIGTADFNFLLRAERNKKKSGRVYTVTYTATDSSGNSSRASATAIVPLEKPEEDEIYLPL